MELVVGGIAVGGSELALRSQVTREDQVDHRPQLEEAVLEWRPGEGDAELRGQLSGGARRLGARVFYALGFVEDRHRPLPFDQLVGGAEENVVGGEHDATAGESLE